MYYQVSLDVLSVKYKCFIIINDYLAIYFIIVM